MDNRAGPILLAFASPAASADMLGQPGAWISAAGDAMAVGPRSSDEAGWDATVRVDHEDSRR
jgi:hypothetical protein